MGFGFDGDTYRERMREMDEGMDGRMDGLEEGD